MALSGHQILVRPIVTEKNTMLNEVGKYCFEVAPHSNKIEIKRAVEAVFGVKVDSVQTMHMQGKVKRQGRNVGRRNDWKKAIVTLKPDQKIELFEQI